MCIKLYLGILMGLVLATSGTVAQDLPTGEELMAMSMKAAGGVDVYKKMESMHLVGTINMVAMNVKGSIELWEAKGFRSYTRTELPGLGVFDEGGDGSIFWSKSALQGEMILPEGPEVEFKRRGSTFSLLDWKKYYESIKVVGVEDIDGVPCFKLEKKPLSGAVETHWVDRKTHLDKRVKTTVESTMGKMEVVMDMLEYGESGGMKYPSKIAQTVSGQKLVLTFKTMEINPKIPEGRFALPESIKKLLEKQKKKADDAKKKKEQEKKDS